MRCVCSLVFLIVPANATLIRSHRGPVSAKRTGSNSFYHPRILVEASARVAQQLEYSYRLVQVLPRSRDNNAQLPRQDMLSSLRQSPPRRTAFQRCRQANKQPVASPRRHNADVRIARGWPKGLDFKRPRPWSRVRWLRGRIWANRLGRCEPVLPVQKFASCVPRSCRIVMLQAPWLAMSRWSNGRRRAGQTRTRPLHRWIDILPQKMYEILALGANAVVACSTVQEQRSIGRYASC
ncbi:hypothetical protein J3F83DRAFT_374104 [Trichoderma novae-zelandiae]